MCGHDVAGPPAPDVKLEKRCFPCEAGMLQIRLEKAAKEIKGLNREGLGYYHAQRNKLWDALSDILEEPALAIPAKLRKAGLRAVAFCQKADYLARRK